jgi:hypothetical protein
MASRQKETKSNPVLGTVLDIWVVANKSELFAAGQGPEPPEFRKTASCLEVMVKAGL